LPLEVLEQVRDELTDWQGRGMSVMEVGHRSKAFAACAAEAEADLRELLTIPAHYRVLFLQGGRRRNSRPLPLNLTTPESVVDFVNTGHWSKKALSEAQHFCRVNVAADGAGGNYNDVPAEDAWHLSRGAAYLHYTPNETIAGVEFPFVPGRRGAAGCRHVFDDPVPAHRHQPLWADLRRRAEEHRPCGSVRGHRP